MQPSLEESRSVSLDEATRRKHEALLKQKFTASLQRQASLPSPSLAPSSPARKIHPKIAKGLVRMNSNPHILPSEEEHKMDTLDEIDLLHNIAKTPNILKGHDGKRATLNPGNGSGGGLAGQDGSGRIGEKKLVKQKSLNRTLSTSVLRIPKKKTFWSWAHGEDLIVTPFAQILASLRSVRQNYVTLTNVPAPRNSTRRHPTPIQPQNQTNHASDVGRDENYVRNAIETLEELDWCLDQLETIQTHRSVSDMATSKVRRPSISKKKKKTT
ncbi:hypothetical protein TCAL_15581 [Tigriopus californicus]|uniref:3',5'-cyclic-AMP phosphodiesterase n=1 Tax=Tigriopus californicus TaxID=6832 RepID=A0A553PDP2_TIGCA|nr:hypothetical protein TCAL_15581 [Tigriopus californicus]